MLNNHLDQWSANGRHRPPPVFAGGPDSEGYLGRRVERDGSWTMYHVFTGEPARVSNRVMTGLTKAEATSLMMERNGNPLVK